MYANLIDNSLLVADFFWCIFTWLMWFFQFFSIFAINAIVMKQPNVKSGEKTILVLISVFILMPANGFWLVYIYWQETQIRLRNKLYLNKCTRAIFCCHKYITFRDYRQDPEKFSWMLTCNSFDKQYRSLRWCGIIFFSIGAVTAYNYFYYDLLLRMVFYSDSEEEKF